MPLIMGILAQGVGAAPVSAGAYDLLETQTLASDTASVTFTGLGSYTDYKHLQIRGVARVDQVNDQLSLYLNSDTGANYAYHEISGSGSTVFSGSASSASRMQITRVAYSTMTADVFTGIVCDILDPFSTAKNTTVRTLGGTSTTTRINFYSGLWNDTSSLTSIEIFPGATNLVAGSRFSLYGIRGA